MKGLRIVSLVPSQTELLFALGVGEAVVGRTKFCIHPAQAVASVPLIGGTKNVQIGRVAALNPTLILANHEENTRADVEALRAFAPVHVTDVRTLPDALAMIQAVGALVGKKPEAAAISHQITASMDAISPPEKRLPVAYVIWRKPWMVAARDTFIDAMLDAAGFTNAFAGQTRYPVVTDADWRAVNPAVIFLSSEPYPFKARHIAEVQRLCPQAQLRLVDGELFSWYGSRLVQSAAYFMMLRRLVERNQHVTRSID